MTADSDSGESIESIAATDGVNVVEIDDAADDRGDRKFVELSEVAVREVRRHDGEFRKSTFMSLIPLRTR